MCFSILFSSSVSSLFNTLTAAPPYSYSSIFALKYLIYIFKFFKNNFLVSFSFLLNASGVKQVIIVNAFKGVGNNFRIFSFQIVEGFQCNQHQYPSGHTNIHTQARGLKAIFPASLNATCNVIASRSKTTKKLNNDQRNNNTNNNNAPKSTANCRCCCRYCGYGAPNTIPQHNTKLVSDLVKSTADY